MSSLPSISVVVPCFNAERWIGATLDSVFGQAWPNLEVLVVDDGSTDNSVELVRSRFPMVKLLRQANSGVAAARNLGIRFATGDWIAFVDADDIWLPGKLAAQWEALQFDPEVRLAYSAWHVWHSEDPSPSQTLMAQLGAEGDNLERWGGCSGWIYPQLLLECCVWTSTVLAQRALLDEIGVFDTTLRIGEDLDLWLRASRVTAIVRVSRPLALYRMHPNSITKAAPETNFQAQVVLRAIERWGYSGPNGGRAIKSDVDKALARTWNDYAGANLAAGNSQRARTGSLMSVRTRWQQTQGWKLLARSLAKSVLPTGTRL